MNSLLKHTRATLVLMAAFAAAAAMGFAVDSTFQIAGMWLHPDGSTLAANLSWMISQWSYMFPALLVGVYIAVSFPACRPRTYVIAMVCIQGLVIVRALWFAPSHAVPSWLWTQTLLVVPILFCSGFWFPLRRRWEAATAADGHRAAIPN